MRVENMVSSKGNTIANQFIINGNIENGILYHSMDFLPCELGVDASSHFGE